MRIFVAGTRGIPDIPGGVEKHCQELYPRIAAMGHDVFLATRRPYVANPQAEWNGVRLVHTFCPRSKSLEAIVHTLAAVLKARWLRPDLVHIHAVGPGLMVPFARLLGLRVVVTNHGPDYNRQKWGRPARMMLRLGEYFGGKFSNSVIVISKEIKDIISKRCKRESSLVYNGVPVPARNQHTEYLEEIGILPGKYILTVARLVPEKGLHDLINAFQKIETDSKLVIAGEADHATGYSHRLKATAKRDDRIIMPGYVTGERLNQLYTHARLFVLPSYHEGLPIALLEALSYGLHPLVSDIPANKEVGLNDKFYFTCGDVLALQNKISNFINNTIDDAEKNALRSMVAKKYNWLQIAEQTVGVYKTAIEKKQ